MSEPQEPFAHPAGCQVVELRPVLRAEAARLREERDAARATALEEAAEWHDGRGAELEYRAVRARAGDNPLGWEKPYVAAAQHHRASARAIRALIQGDDA